MKVGTSESDLGRRSLSVSVCVCEDLAIILHAWCLYLAGPSLSLVSASVFVSASAYLRAGVLYFDFTLFVYALKHSLSVIYNQKQTRYTRSKMSTDLSCVMSRFKRGRALMLSWLV